MNAELQLTTSLVLKEPGANGEKGVLYASFEFNWLRLVAHRDARALLRDYLLVGASSWSPGDHAVLACLQGLSDDPVFIGISHRSDIEQYALWSPAVVPLPLTAGDWVDPDLYSPKPHAERRADIVVVSHFARWKRHWLLFEALQRMRRDLRIVLIGRRANARTAADIWREAHAFGVRQHIDLYQGLEFDQVAAHQCDARVALALSRREGSCVSVTEAMFADTPVLMMDDAHIGTRAYINPATGRIASRRRLPAVLSEMIEHSAEFSARDWALQHVSARASSRRLNRVLRDYCRGRGLPWTRDIVPLCWRYVPQYLDRGDEGRMRGAIARLHREHGVALAVFAGERAGSQPTPVAPAEPATQKVAA